MINNISCPLKCVINAIINVENNEVRYSKVAIFLVGCNILFICAVGPIQYVEMIIRLGAHMPCG